MTERAALSIVVEARTDADIVRAILGKELSRRVRIYAAQGRVALATVARNVSIHEGGPVLLVMDSETRDPQLSAQLSATNTAAMSGGFTLAGVGTNSSDGLEALGKVFAFVPEIEVVFFEAPLAMQQVLGKKVSAEKIKQGLLAPRSTAKELLAETHTAQNLNDALKAVDPKVLLTSKQAKSLKDTVEVTMAVHAAGS